MAAYNKFKDTPDTPRRILKDHVNLRPCPEISRRCAPIGSLTLHEAVQVLEQQGEWLRVRRIPSKTEGYVTSQMVAPAVPRVRFVGIDVQWDTEQMARLFVEVYKLPYPIGRDTTGAICNTYGIDATPTSFFIDKKGVLLERVEGEQTFAELTQRIERLLNAR